MCLHQIQLIESPVVEMKKLSVYKYITTIDAMQRKQQLRF